MQFDISFSDHINDAIRILIIANSVKSKKAFRLTAEKVRLLDYYLRFPRTMLCTTEEDLSLPENLDEYYAFFHWKPDVLRYQKAINYLIAKGLLKKNTGAGSVSYDIAEQGSEALDKLHSSYAEKLKEYMDKTLRLVGNSSNGVIEKEIEIRSSIYKRNLQGRDWNG